MIHESYHWRKKLIKISKRLERNNHFKKEWSDKKYAKLEQDVMLGFYIIRKLMEANKLSNQLCSTNFTIQAFQNNGNSVTRLNNHRFEEYYDLENSKETKRDLKFLINQFVHSYVFAPVIELINEQDKKQIESTSLSDDEKLEKYYSSEKKIVGLFVNTNSNKNEYLFQLDFERIIQIFNDVGECVVTRVEMKYNTSKRDFDSIQYDQENKISDELEDYIKSIDNKSANKR